MSGGAFNYDQHRIGRIADDIEGLILSNDDATLDEYSCSRGRGYPPDIIQQFKRAVTCLRYAEVYVQRIDWLVSGDDGEDSFRKRLANDLAKLGDKQ